MELHETYRFKDQMEKEFNPESVEHEIERMEQNIETISKYIKQLKAKLTSMSPVNWVYFLSKVKRQTKYNQWLHGTECEYRDPVTENFIKYPVTPRKTNVTIYEINIYKEPDYMFSASKWRNYDNYVCSTKIIGSENKALANQIIDQLKAKYPNLMEVNYF
jgi:hypothetical protein